MAQRGARAGWDSPADRPSVLEITVESAPRRGPTVHRAHVVIAIAVLGAIVAAIAIAALPGGGPAGPPSLAPQVPAPARPSVLVQIVSPLPQAGCAPPPVPPLARGKVKACRR